MSQQEEKFAKEVKPREISEEMETAYLDYAMSVIVSRALPDVRDGLKPVQRRILYTMRELKLNSSAKFRKSATVVGAVLGRYHPHGDIPVYDALVRMAQDFSLRYPLIEGQGNFGSLDGDSPAAMRYTECRLSPLAEEMLEDIEKETVDFMPNYDGTRKEPKVLPAKLPNLIVNGTLGIAVGMATNIPPHNLGEVVDALVYLIDHSQASIDDLLQFIKGPDFPTGGVVYDWQELKRMYSSGKGKVIMRAKAQIEEGKRGKYRIIITEIPFQVNKALLLQKIASLVKDKKISGIADLRDESGKAGVRIVIELKQSAHPKKVLNQLFKFTPLQDIFYVNMLALDGGIQPRVFNLKTLLQAYLNHREEVVVRRTKFELRQAEARKHILEGLLVALDHLDEVIQTIRRSPNRTVAHQRLRKKFKLSDKQAEAILEMRLHQLSALERRQIVEEYKRIKALIRKLKALLASRRKILGVIKKELKELKEKYADERRTKIIKQKIGELTLEDLVANEPNLVVITKDNYIKRMPVNTYRRQARGGKGVLGMATKEEDEVARIFVAMTHDRLLFFTNQGRVLEGLVYDLPEGTRQAKGMPLVNFIELKPQEKVTAIVNLSPQSNYRYLFMATKKGLVKKLSLEDLSKIRKSGIVALRLRKGDELLWAKPTSGRDEIILVSAEGYS
ncbi:DNA gyrase subunit A, partial [bacterium]|nr:DNA gyrase subunit A [bacterium]